MNGQTLIFYIQIVSEDIKSMKFELLKNIVLIINLDHKIMGSGRKASFYKLMKETLSYLSTKSLKVLLL